MTSKEIGIIKRRFKGATSNITHIRGCCVSEHREIISEFNQSLGRMSADDLEMALDVMKKTLSGTKGKTLHDIAFGQAQMGEGTPHERLMELRDSKLNNDNLIAELYQDIINSYEDKTPYLILLAHETFDVVCTTSDGEALEDGSTNCFSYIICSICPLKLTKPVLCYHSNKSAFAHLGVDFSVASPVNGFLFPAFDDQESNITGALYFTKNTGDNSRDLMRALFGDTKADMPADTQKDLFYSMLSSQLGLQASLPVVRAVQEKLTSVMDTSKALGTPEVTTISKETVVDTLSASGVSGDRLDAFSESFDETFGPDAELKPHVLVDPGKIKVETSNVTIQVDPACGHLLRTEVIEGKKYILIQADGDNVTVNGVSINIG